MAVIEGNTAEKYLAFAEEFCKSLVQINLRELVFIPFISLGLNANSIN